MDKYQNRGQGTLNSIIALVVFFLIVDIIIGFLMYFDINLEFKDPKSDNLPSIIVTKPATDNLE